MTLWTAARQASLSFTVSWSLLRLVSIELVMPSSHLILCHPLGGLWPIYSDPESFLGVHVLLSQDGSQRQEFWEVVSHVVSPFDLS